VDVSFKAQAVMLVQFLDVLGIYKVEEKKLFAPIQFEWTFSVKGRSTRLASFPG
jgi:hypothetical protein